MDNKMYYNFQLTDSVAKGHVAYLRPYLDTIARRNPPGANLLEIGIGTGMCSVFLEQNGYSNVYAVDNDPDIISNFNNRFRPVFKSKVKIREADGFDLTEVKSRIDGKIGCIHHQGLLEHFSRDQIIKILEHHLQITDDMVVFAVPIEGYIDNGAYDPTENHWPVGWWLNLLPEVSTLYEYGVFGIDTNKNQAYFVIVKKGEGNDRC